MKIYDISQEVFGCVVYAGDTVPEKKAMRRIEKGDLYNLTDINMCTHNGTHIDAPFHFLADGDTVEKIPLEKFIGECYVAEEHGELTEDRTKEILSAAREASPEAAKRILLRGDAAVTEEAARVMADFGIYLVGVESQSVGDSCAPMATHKILLGKKVVLLEGVRLEGISEGVYFLCAAPLNLGGCDGSPCRAVLIEK